jgi:hypothetical protein
MRWTEEQLAQLPQRHGFRLRGLEMTRLETFCDAAFAFAVTLLVIAGDGIPRSVDDLILALKGVPAFVMSFAAIASYWWAHRTWSRRFGLEDGPTTVISLALVVVMLVYVYPLKMVFSAFANFASGGWLPTEFTLTDAADLPVLFVVYGVGFAAQTGMIALLYGRALKVGEALGLDTLERLHTRHQIVHGAVLGGTGLASAVFALVTPASVGVWAGFWYMTLPITMPLLAIHHDRRARDRRAELAATTSPD